MRGCSWIRRIRRSLEGCRFRLSLALDLFEEGFCLDLFGFLIALPFLDRWRYEPYEIMEKWGVHYGDRAVWFCWGRHSKSWYMPWDLVHMKCEVRRPDLSWVTAVPAWCEGTADGRWTSSYPYRYVLRSGEVQERIATIYVERREWRQRWLKWCPWFALHRQSIQIEFNDEVGERAGSWKGGCIGTGYEMRPGESPDQTLARMERDRKFN